MKAPRGKRYRLAPHLLSRFGSRLDDRRVKRRLGFRDPGNRGLASGAEYKITAVNVRNQAQNFAGGIREVHVVRSAAFHPFARQGPDAQIVCNLRPAHPGNFRAPLHRQNRELEERAERIAKRVCASPNFRHFTVTQHPLARGVARRNWQTLEWVRGNFPTLLRPPERGARIGESAAGHRRSAGSHELVERIHRISPSYPPCRQLEKVRERVPDCADGFCAVTLATVYQMQRSPFLDQSIKAQRHLGAFALRVSPHAQSLGARVDPFGHIAETSPGCCSGLLNGNAAPYPNWLTNLPLCRGIGPLHDEGAGFGRSPAHRGRGTRCRRRGDLCGPLRASTRPDTDRRILPFWRLWIADLGRTSGTGPLWVRMAICGDD